MNRAEKMLLVLSDGREHTRGDLFQPFGFYLSNNAAAELRARGYEVAHRRKDGVDTYRLVGSLESAEAPPATPVSAVSSEPWRSNPVSAETAAADVLRDGGQLALSIGGPTNHA